MGAVRPRVDDRHRCGRSPWPGSGCACCGASLPAVVGTIWPAGQGDMLSVQGIMPCPLVSSYDKEHQYSLEAMSFTFGTQHVVMLQEVCSS